MILAIRTFTAEILRKRNFADVLVLMTGSVGSQIVMVAGLPFLTRLYTPAAFGSFAVVQTFSLILVVFVTFRGEAALNYVKTPSIALLCVKALAVFGLVGTAAISLLIVALSLSGGAAAFRQFGLEPSLLFYIPPLTLTAGMSLVLRNWLVRRHRSKAVSIAYGLRGPIFMSGAALGGLLLSGHPGFSGASFLLFSQLAADTACLLVASAHFTRSERGYLWHAPVSLAMTTLRAARGSFLALFWSQVITQLSDRLPLIIVNAAFGPAMAGIYSISDRIVAAPYQLISGAVIDIFNRQAGKAWNTFGRFDKLFGLWLKTLLLLSFLPFLLVILVFYNLTPLILGSAWADASLTLCLLTIWSFGYFNFRVFDRWFVPTGQYFIYFIAIGFRLLAVCLLAVLALSQRIGYIPFVFGFVMASFLVDLVVVLAGLVASRGSDKHH